MDRETIERRLAMTAAAILVLFGILALRLWQVQIVQGDLFLRLSEGNRLRIVTTAAPRGLIVDRAGRAFVVNRPAFTVSVIPQEMRNPEVEVHAIARLLDMDPADVREKLAATRDRPFDAVRLRLDVSKSVVSAVAEARLDLPGVFIDIEPVMEYPYRDTAAHLLGYVGEVSDEELRTLGPQGYEPGELIGKDGVERTYDRYLRGQPGEIQEEVDAQGRTSRILSTTPAASGDTLVLGLDLDVQRAAEEALGDRNGAVVAMDPNSGIIVALVSHPAFDPDLFSAGISQSAWSGLIHNRRQPLVDRVIQGGYPTGSVFKIITGSAALELGLVRPDTRFYCPGFYNLGGHIFHDHEAHGNLSFLDAIAESCNVVFWTISRPVGPDRLAAFARMYGMGEPTGVDLPQESAGVMPDPAWKERTQRQPWYGGDTLNTAVGQGFVLATPLQVARMVAAVANGGTLVVPHAVTEVRSPSGEVVARIAPGPAAHLRLSAQTLAVLQAGLAAVVTRGTAASIQIPGLSVAGKTGTAESPHGKPFAWFAGYAPADGPKLVVVAMVENAGFGAEFAAPIVQRVLEVAFGLPAGNDGHR
jgi:penicillin-binding protein 2